MTLTPEEQAQLKRQAENAQRLRDASAKGSTSWRYYHGEMQRYMASWMTSDREKEERSGLPSHATGSVPTTYTYGHPDLHAPWQFTSDQLQELHHRDASSRFHQELAARDMWNDEMEKADVFETLHEAGLGNPHYRPKKDASDRIYERTDLAPRRTDYTSRDIKVTPYPSLPYTPSNWAAIERVRHELMATMEVQQGSTFPMQAALRVLGTAIKNEDLPYQVFVAAQKVLDNAIAQGLNEPQTKKELDTIFKPDGTQNAITPYQNLPVRSEILAKADAARGESERLIAEVAMKSGRSAQELREITVGKDGYFSHEQIAYIKSRSKDKYLDGSQGTGKTGTEVMAVLYGVATGQYSFREINFGSPTHPATNVLIDKFNDVAQKGFLPGVDWEKARQYQFRTIYSRHLSQLYSHPMIDDGSGRATRGPSAMEQLEKFTGRPLTQYTMVGFSASKSSSDTYDQHIRNVQQERPNLLRDEVKGPLPPNMSFQMLSQEIGRIQTSRYDKATRYNERMKKGKADVESGQLATVDAWLYRYAKYKEEHKFYDPDDIAPLWVKAASQGFIQSPTRSVYVGDEAQDFPHDILYALAVEAKRGTRMMLGGDMGQQITGMSQVRLRQAIPQYFPQAQYFPLSINYRSTQSIVSYGQAMNRQMLAAGMETGPLQIAYSNDIGEPVKTVIRKTWAELHQEEVQSWMSHIGMTPSTIQYNMETGRAPLEGSWPEPAQIPMIVQMDAERDMIKKALIQELTPEMGRSLAEQAVTRMEQLGQLNMPTVVGAKGSTYFGALTSAPRVGQWTEQGYLMNRNVMSGRPKHFLEEYTTPEHFPYTSSYYDNTPMPAVSGGDLYDPLRAAGMGYEAEALYYGHEAKWDYLESDHRRLLEEQQQVTAQGQSLTLTQQQMQAVGPLLDLLATLNPKAPRGSYVQEGSGLLDIASSMGGEELREILDQGSTITQTTMTKAMRDIAEATGQSFKTGRIDAGGLSGKWEMSGSSMTDEWTLRLIEEAVRTGNLDLLNPRMVTNRELKASTSFLPQSAKQLMQQTRGVFGKPTQAHEKEAMYYGKEGEGNYDYPAIAPFPFESPNRFKNGQDDDHMHYPGLAEGMVRRAIYDVMRNPYAKYHRLTKKLIWDQLSNPAVLDALKRLHPQAYKLLGQKFGLPGTVEAIAGMRPTQRLASDLSWASTPYVSATRLGSSNAMTLPLSSENLGQMEAERLRVHQVQHLIKTLLYGDNTPSSLKYGLQEAIAHAIAAGDLDSETLSMLKKSLSVPRDPEGKGKWIEEQNVRLRRGPGGMALLGLIGTATGGLPPAGISLRTLDDMPNILTPGVTVEQLREKALLTEIYRRQGGWKTDKEYPDLREPTYYTLPQEAVEGAINRYPYTAGAVVRNIGNTAEGLAKGYDVIQSRHAPFKTEMDAFYIMLQAGMQGDQGGLRLDDDSPMLGLDQLNRQLTQLTGHYAFKDLSPEQQATIHKQLQQVRDIQRTLRNDSNRDQYAQTLQNVFRMATGMGAFGSGGEPNKTFDNFFRPLRDSERPRTLKSVQTYLDALHKATQEFQGAGSLSRQTFNELLDAMGHDPRHKGLYLNSITDLQKRFGSPSAPSMSLSQFARGDWFSDKDKKERMSILSEMTRIPINQGQMYHFMGGKPGFAGLTFGQLDRQALSAGMAGTLHPLPGHNFRMVYDVQFWRDKKNGMFAPGESYDNLPGNILYGPVYRFNPNGNSDEKDWHLVRADQLALPGGIGTGEGAAIAASSSGLSSQMPKGRVFGASDAIDPMEESPVIKEILDAFNAARQEGQALPPPRGFISDVSSSAGTAGAVPSLPSHTRRIHEIVKSQIAEMHAFGDALAQDVPHMGTRRRVGSRARRDFQGMGLGFAGGDAPHKGFLRSPLSSSSTPPPPPPGGGIPMSSEYVPEEPDWFKEMVDLDTPRKEGIAEQYARMYTQTQGPNKGKWIAGEDAKGHLLPGDSWTSTSDGWYKNLGGFIGRDGGTIPPRRPSSSPLPLPEDDGGGSSTLPPPSQGQQPISYLVDRSLQKRIFDHVHQLRKAGYGETTHQDMAQNFGLGPQEAKDWHAWAYGQGPVPKMASGLHVPGGTSDPNYQEWGRQGRNPYGFKGQNPLHIPPEQLQADLNPNSPIYASAQEAKALIAEKRAQLGHVPNPLTDISVPFQAPSPSSAATAAAGVHPTRIESMPGGKAPVHITADSVSIASSSGAGGFAWVGRAAGALGGLLGAGGSSSSGGGGIAGTGGTATGGGDAPPILNGTAMPPGFNAANQGQGAPPGGAAAAFFNALFGNANNQGQGGGPPGGGGRFPNVAQAFSYGNGDIMIGRFLSRLGGDFSTISQMAGKTASDAAMEGGNYRRYSMQVPYDASETYGRTMAGAGPTGVQSGITTQTRWDRFGHSYQVQMSNATGSVVSPISQNTPGTSGFFDFTSQSPQGIQALQANMLPMYSDTQIVKGIHDYTSLNAHTKLNGPTVRATTDIMAVAALSGLDPTQVAEMAAQTTGAQASGLYGSSITGTRNANYYTPQLLGMMHSTLGGNLSGPAVQNYMQAMSSMTPVLAGIGAPDAMNQAGTMLQLAKNAGLSPEQFQQVGQVTGSLAQMGSNPNLQQQFVLAQTYGEKNLTAAPQYWQYKQGLQQQGMQLQGLQLQQRMNVPQISINADNAQIQMGRVSIQAQQFQLAQGQATFAEQQYQQTQQLGPIGETPQQTGRSAYFQYMARQTAAGYNPLSQDNASTFQFKGQPFGLQNLEFYTGIEHQRNMLTLGRSPLLADAAFQEQMKYLNKQETFYNQELALQNQQRQFTVTWTQKSLEMQAKQLAAASNVEKVQEQQLKVDIENQKIYAANLPQMVSNLQKIIINTQQQMQGQGPIRGHNMSDITQLVQDIAKSTPDNQLEARANQLFGNDPTSAGIFLSLVKQVKATPASQISATLNSTTDQGLISELMGQNQAGASLGQQVQAGQSNTALFQGGIDAWNNLNKTIQQSNKLNQQLASAMSGSTGLTYWVSQMTGKASALADSMGALSSIMGGIGGIFKLFAGGAGGAGTGGGAGAGEGMMMGVGGMVGPPPASQGEFSSSMASRTSDSALLNQMNQVKGPVSAMTHILENLQAFMQKKSGSTSFAHYGIGSPQVNADFHQKMWYGFHQGVDLAANQGSPLSEFIGGEVKATGFFPWGGEVDVEIPGGTTERYLHLSQIGVHPGQVVRRGDRIGLTGGGTPASGFGYWSRGSHLHTQYDYGNINQGIDPWVIWAMAGEKNLGEFIGSSSLGSFGNTSRADRLGAAIAAKNMGGGGLYHLYGGGIAMRPVTSRLADGGEPEAVIPLSKLKSVLSGNVGGGSSSSSTNTSSSSGGVPLKQYIVDKLIGTLNLTQHLASSTMSDAEKDQLMADTLDALQTAAYAFMSHNG